jgi:hypothetical protein
MRMRNLVLALVAISVGISQAPGDKALMTRVYDGNDFGSYYLDPIRWIGIVIAKVVPAINAGHNRLSFGCVPPLYSCLSSSGVSHAVTVIMR